MPAEMAMYLKTPRKWSNTVPSFQKCDQPGKEDANGLPESIDHDAKRNNGTMNASFSEATLNRWLR